MIAFALAALIGTAQQTIVVPTTAVAPSQALPATASSPQIKTPDPATTSSSPRAPVAATPAVTPQPAPTPAQPKAAVAAASSSSTSLNTVDRTALPIAQSPAAPSSSLPAGVTGGPVFGGTPSIQTAGH